MQYAPSWRPPPCPRSSPAPWPGTTGRGSPGSTTPPRSAASAPLASRRWSPAMWPRRPPQPMPSADRTPGACRITHNKHAVTPTKQITNTTYPANHPTERPVRRSYYNNSTAPLTP
eukprot:1184088-Prorocentrum_minimum.AAC.3